MKAFRGFICSGVVLGIIMTAFVWVTQKALPEKSFTSAFFIIPFVMVVTIMFHYVLMKASIETPRSFVGKFMAFSGVKLFLYIVVIGMYAFFVKKEIVSFLLIFFLSYIVYTVLEVSAILKFLKKLSS